MAGESNIGNLAGFIGDAIRQGLSQNKTEQLLRDSGVTGSHDVLRGEIQRVRATLAANPEVSSLPNDSAIDAAHYKAWNARGRGAFVHQVEVGQFSPGTGGIIKIQWTVRSDTPLSPADAQQRAVDEATEGAEDNSGGEGARVLGGVLTGLHFATNATAIDPF